MTDRKEPYIIEIEKKGAKAFCKCRRSQNLPYCDGSHKGTEFRPFVVKFEGPKQVTVCGCGHSGNLPYCDGTHSTL